MCKVALTLDILCAGLLAVAKELGLDLAGVSFHVGSGASNPDALPEGIAAAAAVFDAAAALGFDMRVLDIGGGFSGGKMHPLLAWFASVTVQPIRWTARLATRTATIDAFCWLLAGHAIAKAQRSSRSAAKDLCPILGSSPLQAKSTLPVMLSWGGCRAPSMRRWRCTSRPRAAWTSSLSPAGLQHFDC